MPVSAIKDGKLVTNGGRVLGVTATAAHPARSRKRLTPLLTASILTNCTACSDIGARALAAMKAQEG